MLRRILTYACLILSPAGLGAQYISRVMEYVPAPGQFINSEPWGTPSSSQTIVGGIYGNLSLGAYGGYVVFAFEEAVENHPDNPFGIDFTVFGNATSEWSEPGVVWVMKDENQNTLPDDTWYELAGSDYHFSTSRRVYSVSYTNPGGSEARDVPWTGPDGTSGVIRANSIHTQSYYPLTDSFPHIPEDSYTLTGSMIRGAVDVDHPPLITSLRRAFGYADNQVRGSGPLTVPDNPYTPEAENSGGDAFDIAWAVDSMGSYVELDRIHFIKVQNGVLHQGGWLGEISTEISGAVDVAPDPGISGMLDQLVIRDLPAEMDTGSVQLEVILFQMGRPLALPQLQWNSSESWARVDQDNILHLNGSGVLSLYAHVRGDPSLADTVSTLVHAGLGVGTGVHASEGELPSASAVYPNPVHDFFQVSGVEQADLSLLDLNGKTLMQVRDYTSGHAIDAGELGPGLYLLRIEGGSSFETLKLLKQ